jgi:hypothetical protein
MNPKERPIVLHITLLPGDLLYAPLSAIPVRPGVKARVRLAIQLMERGWVFGEAPSRRMVQGPAAQSDDSAKTDIDLSDFN